MASESSREINARVAASIHGGSSIYRLDMDALAAANADLILTQELCAVCAVSYREVAEAVRQLDADATVVSLEPTSIEGIFNTISTVGAMAEAEDEAVGLIGLLRERLARIENRVLERRLAGIAPRRVVCLEWVDPPFCSGHWVPEQVRRAGGWDLLGRIGEPAVETTWEQLRDVDPEQLMLIPCGFDAPRTADEWRLGEATRPTGSPSSRAVRNGEVYALDGSAYFSRPGPRVIEGVELLAELFDPTLKSESLPAGRVAAGGSGVSQPRPAQRAWPPARSTPRSTACGAAGRTRRGPTRTWRAGHCSAPTASAAPRTTSSCASDCATDSSAAPRRDGRALPEAPPISTSLPSTGQPTPTEPTAEPTISCAPTTPRAPPEYDDWYLRRGRYSHGVIADAAWNAELDAATQWLDALPISGEIVELAAGTGWWSPLLASKGQLSLYDAVEEPLDRARDRLLAHGLAAHIHVRDAWARARPPGRRAVLRLLAEPRAAHRLDDFLAICRAWLKPGGLFAFIDSRRDPESSAADHPAPDDDQSLRRLDDGREFTIPKVYYEPAELEAALRSAGFAEASVATTPRFFLLGRATAAD